MHLVDITMFYAPTSGGVRTYLDCKHSYLTRQVGVRHSVLVPAGIDAPDADFHCLGAAPLGTTGYRFPLRGGAWLRTLCRLQPDLIRPGIRIVWPGSRWQPAGSWTCRWSASTTRIYRGWWRGDWDSHCADRPRPTYAACTDSSTPYSRPAA